MTCIKQHVDSVSAVLILADGRSLGINVDINCILSALSSFIPKTLLKNIAFVLTHVWGPLWSDFLRSKVPWAFKSSPIFLLDNPIPHSYEISLDPILRSAGKSCEQRALDMLVKLFDWLDGLKPQPATEIVRFYEQYQNIETKTIDVLDQRAQEVDLRAEIDRLLITLKKHSAVSLSGCLHLSLESYARWMQDMAAFSGSEKTADIPILKQQSTTTREIDGQVLVDKDMKMKWDEAKDGNQITTTLIAVNEMVLHELKPAIECAMGDLVQLVGWYDGLSLAGGCSAEVRGVVWSLEALENMDIEKDELKEVKENLAHMKRRLELLSIVEDEAKKGVLR